MNIRTWIACIALVGLVLSSPAWALDQASRLALVADDNEQRVVAMNQVIQAADVSALPLLQAIADDQVRVAGEQVLVVGDSTIDIVTAQTVSLPEDAREVVNNNRMRNELDKAIAALTLTEGDEATRLSKAETLAQTEPGKEVLPLLQQAEQQEQNPKIKTQLQQIRVAIELRSEVVAERLAAVQALSENNSSEVKSLLSARLEQETDAEVKAAIEDAIKTINDRLVWYERAGTLFTGLSLGSVLLLAALGLAITYGLMGVINMAHGEMMMLGAYATFVVQNLFRQYYPAAFDAYVLVAIPVAFVFTALIGMLMERTVIRHLYGRPLETLLATWGISLILMQVVRSLFGAQNVSVENPSWMSGGIEVSSNLVLPWNRIDIIVFAFLVLLLCWVLLNKTRLGLYVRAVTQNRSMASCVGVNTNKVDTLAFGLGSGIAGLAGVALAQIGNVGPDLGQAYIVDSFMVVVLGGVGQLAGAVYAALGLGVLSKFFEGYAGAVLAKIMILVLVIIFIQKRPQGLFALKGRSVD